MSYNFAKLQEAKPQPMQTNHVGRKHQCDFEGLCVQRGWQFCTAIHDITMACSIQPPQLKLLLQGLLMGSRQVRLRSLQHRSGDDDLCNVVVPWVGQVGPQVLKGASSGVGDGLDTEAQEGDKCKTSYSHMIPHKCQHHPKLRNIQEIRHYSCKMPFNRKEYVLLSIDV